MRAVVMSIEVNIEGLDQVQEKLKRIGNPRLMKNAARRSARKAMAIVRDAARAAAKDRGSNIFLPTIPILDSMELTEKATLLSSSLTPAQPIP